MSVTNIVKFQFVVDGDSAIATDIKNDIIQYIQGKHRKVHSMVITHTNEIQQWWAEPIVIREPLERQVAGPTFPTMERQQAVPPQDAFGFTLPTEEQMEAARAAFPGVEEDEDGYGYADAWEEGGDELFEEMETATASEESEEEEQGYPTEEEESDDEEEGEAATGEGGDPYQNCTEEGLWSHLHSQIESNPEEVMLILQEWKDAGRIHAITGLTSGGSRRARVVMYKRALRTEGVYRDEGDEKGYLRWDGKILGYWNKALKSFIIPPKSENIFTLQKFLSDQNRDPAVC